MFFENRAHHSRMIAIIILVVMVAINAGVVIAAAASMTQEETTVGELTDYNENNYDAIRLNYTTNKDDFKDLYWLKNGATELYIDTKSNAYGEKVEETSTTSEKEEAIDEKALATYIVETGDSLWKIAEKVYGDGTLYKSLIELNGLKNEYSNIFTGQTIQYYSYQPTASAVSTEYTKLHKDDPKPEKTVTSQVKNGNSGSNMTYQGKFFITGYDPYCVHCCGKANGITASGTKATVGRTIATSKKYPFGTKLYIEGYGTYIVEDRGVSGNVIDVVAESHEACYALTKHNVNVYVVND